MNNSADKSKYEKHVEYAKQYQIDNYDEHKQHMRNYVKKHKDKILEYNKAYKKKKYSNDYTFKKRQTMKTTHSTFMNGNRKDFSDVIGLDLDEYKAYIATLLKDGYDWANYKKEWRIGRINNELDVNDIDSVYNFFNYKNVKILYKYT